MNTDPATAEDRMAAIRARLDAAEQVITGKRRQDDAVQVLWFHAVDDIALLLSELEAAQARLDKVAEFIDQRREVITALRNAGTGAQENGDYPRWQGHAEARRVLAEALGIDLDKETGGLARALGLGEEGDE